MLDLDKLSQEISSKITQINNRQELDSFKTFYLGKKGTITEAFKGMGQVAPDQKKDYAAKLNNIKSNLIDKINSTQSKFDLKEIEEYYMNNFGITVNWYALYSPSSLSIKNIPNKEDIPYIPTDEIRGELMKEEVPSELEKGYEYIRSLEDHRGFKILGRNS